MIRHVVLWRFHESASGSSRVQNLEQARTLLLALPLEIPEILSLEVGIGGGRTAEDFDLCLFSTFRDRDALRVYQHHPAHLRVVEFLRLVRSGRVVVDYEVPGDGLGM